MQFRQREANPMHEQNRASKNPFESASSKPISNGQPETGMKKKPGKLPAIGVQLPRSVFAEYNLILPSFMSRGDIPVILGQAKGVGQSLIWKLDPSHIDYKYYYPIFVDGIRDSNPQVRTLAFLGACDLFERGPNKVLECLPQFILPIRCKLKLNKML